MTMEDEKGTEERGQELSFSSVPAYTTSLPHAPSPVWPLIFYQTYTGDPSWVLQICPGSQISPTDAGCFLNNVP